MGTAANSAEKKKAKAKPQAKRKAPAKVAAKSKAATRKKAVKPATVNLKVNIEPEAPEAETQLTVTQTAIARAVQAAQAAGVSREQLENFFRAGVVLQPRQFAASAAARSCDFEGGPTEIGYGGARGGGKSHWMLSQMAADDCQRMPGLKCLLLRKVGSAVKEQLQDLRQKTLRGIPHEFKESAGQLVFPNGSMIILGHFKDEKDVDKYLGLEYDIIGVEEATTLSASKYRMIRTCNRTSKTNWRPRMYSTTNPGGLGHAWYKALFIDAMRRGLNNGTRFIQATVRDNAFVNKEYRGTLESLTGWQRKAWLDGDWDIAAGQFFTTWRHPVHVAENPIIVQPHWNVWCSLDYGFTHWTMVYLLAEDGDGHVYIVAEHGARGWLVERHATAIHSMLDREGVELHRLSSFVAGADCFAKRHNGSTIAKDYKSHDITLTAANDDRINGAAEFLKLLGDVESEIPNQITISPNCVRIIECMPSLQHDPNRPEDVLKVDCDDDGAGGDDSYDSVRYGLMARRRKIVGAY